LENRLSSDDLLKYLDLDESPSSVIKSILSAFTENIEFEEQLPTIGQIVRELRNNKNSMREALVLFLGEPKGNAWLTGAPMVSRERLGFYNGTLYLPPLEKCADNNVIAAIFGLSSRLQIPIEFEDRPDLDVDEKYKYFYRSVSLFVRELGLIDSTGRIDLPKQRTKSEALVHIARALVIRESAGDLYKFTTNSIKELCGDIKGRPGGYKQLSTMLPPNNSQIYLGILKELVQQVGRKGPVIPDAAFYTVSEVLGWKTRKIKKRGREDKIVKFKPHTVNNIRYLPNNMRDTWYKELPQIEIFRRSYEAVKNDPAYHHNIDGMNDLLNKAYSEFFPFRRRLRLIFNHAVEINGVNESQINSFEAAYIASENLYQRALEDLSNPREIANDSNSG
jgi:hypothetical protein